MFKELIVVLETAPRSEELSSEELGFSSEEELVELLDELAIQLGQKSEVEAKYRHLCTGDDCPAEAVKFNLPGVGKVSYNSGYYSAVVFIEPEPVAEPVAEPQAVGCPDCGHPHYYPMGGCGGCGYW